MQYLEIDATGNRLTFWIVFLTFPPFDAYPDTDFRELSYARGIFCTDCWLLLIGASETSKLFSLYQSDIDVNTAFDIILT